MRTKRQLGLASAVALVVANTIGTGVFTTSGFLIGDLGSRWAVLGVWIGGGVIAMLGALSYGALARRIPESGGEYLFLSKTLHPAAGYLAGWTSLLAGFSAPIAAAAVAFQTYTSDWLPEPIANISGSVLIIAASAIHAADVRKGAWVQNVAVAAKLACIAVFLTWAAWKVEMPDEGVGKGVPDAGLVAVSLVWVYFSYAGWNAAVYIGGEVRDPERNLPRSLLIGTGMVMLLYLAMNAVFVFATPMDAIAGKLEVAAIAARHIGGEAAAVGVTALIALALVTSVSSMTMAGPRVYARMAMDGYLPCWMEEIDGRPRNAIWFQAAAALVMLWTATFDALLTYIGFTLGLSSAATVVGLILLKRREGAALKVIGWPWIPSLFVVAIVAISTFAIARRPIECLIGFGTLILGLCAWRLQHRVAGSRDG